MIIRVPKSIEAYIYRGKLFSKVRQYERAIKDFDLALKIDKKRS